MPISGFGSDSLSEKWLKEFSLKSIHKLFFFTKYFVYNLLCYCMLHKSSLELSTISEKAEQQHSLLKDFRQKLIDAILRLWVIKCSFMKISELHAQKRRLKITQLEKARFIKVNELKLTQVELFSFSYFMCAAANAYELF